MILNASIDTSFWNIASQIGVIPAQKLILAVQAYMERETDLRGGAAMAGVSYNRFLNELQKRNIVVLEDDYFLDRLAELADAFNNETLRQAVEQIASGLN